MSVMFDSAAGANHEKGAEVVGSEVCGRPEQGHCGRGARHQSGGDHHQPELKRSRRGFRRTVAKVYVQPAWLTEETARYIAERAMRITDVVPPVTELSPAGDFWEAEPEHQDYLER
jgi:hypothetical protein